MIKAFRNQAKFDSITIVIKLAEVTMMLFLEEDNIQNEQFKSGTQEELSLYS